MNVNILDHINISDQLEIEEIDLPKKWYRVVERFERYNGRTAFVSVTTKQNSSDFYLSIFYDVVDDFGNIIAKNKHYCIKEDAVKNITMAFR